jgi:hypothetical protein
MIAARGFAVGPDGPKDQPNPDASKPHAAVGFLSGGQRRMMRPLMRTGLRGFVR